MMTDPNSEKSYFDLIPIIIAGVNQTARPVEFEMDRNQDITGVMAYETTCPRCSQLAYFAKSEIVVDASNNSIVKCRQCSPKSNDATLEDAMLIERLSKAPEHHVFTMPTSATLFSDPIASGTMKVAGATKLN